MRIVMLLAAVALAGRFGMAAPVSFEDRHSREVAANPTDLQFTLLITNGQRRFRPGELIPITLQFSSSTADKYKLSTRNYDRSGRLWSEEFTTDHEDVVDPLASYLGSGVMGFIGGGLGGERVLSSQPTGVNLVLNDWYRFDGPGRYRLFLKSKRLQRERLPGESGQEIVQFAAVSNILEIEISAPDPAWEAWKIAELRKVLESATASDANAVRLGMQELENLGTPDAIRLIFNLAREKRQDLLWFGLIKSANRPFVTTELDHFLEDPNTAFTSWMLTLRAFFDYAKQYPAPLVVMTPSDAQNFRDPKIQAEAKRRSEEFETMKRKVAVRLMPTVARKSSAARDECVKAIGDVAPVEAKAAGLIEADDYGMTRSQLIEAFDTFSEDKKLKLVSDKWGLIRGPEMLPGLRRIIEQAPPDPTPPILEGQMVWIGPSNLVENALFRLKELSPDEEMRFLLEDITRPKPRFAGTAVRELPAQDVPKVDDVVGPKLKVVDRKLSPSVYLEQFTVVFSAIPLASKFGTKRLLKQMRELYRDSNWDCMMTDWFVAYFVRVDAEEGARVFTEGMAERKKNLCYQFLISQVSGIVWNGVVQKQVMATLNEAEGETASSAASALAMHGGKDVEPALWQRLEKWSERWNGRATGFCGNPITGVGRYEGEPSLGSALFQAIANARAWVLDEVRARKLVSLCIDDACREEWGHYKFSPVRLSDSLGLYRNGHVFQVGPYGSESATEAEAKINQYPAGTVFEFCPMKDSGDQMQQMENFAKARGMVVQGCTKAAAQ